MEKYLEEIFKHLNTTFKSLESRLKAEGFKARVLQVLKAWEEWLVYHRQFIHKLRTIFLGIPNVCINSMNVGILLFNLNKFNFI